MTNQKNFRTWGARLIANFLLVSLLIYAVDCAVSIRWGTGRTKELLIPLTLLMVLSVTSFLLFFKKWHWAVLMIAPVLIGCGTHRLLLAAHALFGGHSVSWSAMRGIYLLGITAYVVGAFTSAAMSLKVKYQQDLLKRA